MAANGKMTSKERVRRALEGADIDRPPFSLWHHFGLQAFPAERHAAATLDFHRKFRTDIVKVMSDFPYPKPAGGMGAIAFDPNPFPEQLRALDIVREALARATLSRPSSIHTTRRARFSRRRRSNA